MVILPTSSSRRARASRKAVRRRRKLVGLFIGAGLCAVTVAFVVGYLNASRAVLAAPTVSVAAVDPASRTEALRLLDEALQARHEERFNAAANAAQAARQTDETLPGVDMMIAEIAFKQHDAGVAERAARAALARGENVSSANLLLALQAWRLRAERRKSASEAADEAARWLAEAASAQPSDEAVWFFWGEMMRFVGREDQAHRLLLEARHRTQPWKSSSTLEAKQRLAAESEHDRR